MIQKRLSLTSSILILFILSLFLQYSQASNTFAVLNCRANKCFDDFYACHSDKACLDQYNSLNKCMQSDCLSSNNKQIQCYNDCKNSISNPHLSSYIACTDRLCSNESFFNTCGDFYQNLLREQNKNSQSWKNFSSEVNKCVSKACGSYKSNKKELLHCQLKQTAECSKYTLNSFRHISFLNNFYECSSDEIASSLGEGQGFVSKVLGIFGL
ncbi:transmembrane protein, putative (macronuclear) [Tetrahymena thermophila SB210]|uniref:Transmembrane protein, putative n=1 Tax=Tetrahymena thermophila (strain SB210) TaxID=312017 RepID=I7MCF1_TETTS|nr:transmembrane protein, putative [Tetrahymena thermophila SB210]EAR83778.2 transmembrane protein, putative [Tetrahymena thermophila SB210]|eukprot:XP_001031441.2 transmembrane protein, putative [Tetrahymena thermophila SB210]